MTSTEIKLKQLRALAIAVLKHWGIHNATLGLIKMRENCVFSVLTGDSKKYALRIHREGYHSKNNILSELQFMQALGTNSIKVPIPINSLDGNILIEKDNHLVDLFAWIEGHSLANDERFKNDIEFLQTQYEKIGMLAAALHNISEHCKITGHFERHAWDEEGIAGENPFWGRFWELDALSAGEQKLIIKAKDKVFIQLSAVEKSKQNYGLIHADFVADNFMINENELYLIDFDDAGWGWHLFELATPLYSFIGKPEYELVYDALIKGYRSKRNLPDEALSLMPLFLLARSFTYLGWVQSRQETETAQLRTRNKIDKCLQLISNYNKQ
jgi:Ser/Thr protein kinase RdoA (MazF antagonist)